MFESAEKTVNVSVIFDYDFLFESLLFYNSVSVIKQHNLVVN